MEPQIDQLYIYRSRVTGRFPQLNVRHIDGQTIKFKRGTILEKSDKIYRYAKTYEIDGRERTLLMLTEDSDKTRVGKFFTASKKLIDNELWVKAEANPITTNISHIYDSALPV